jgi:serine/threonine protein kinase
MPSSNIQQLQKGTILNNRYRINSYLNRGGFSFTYKAEDIIGLNTVCIKELFLYGNCTRGQDNSVITQGLQDFEFSYFKDKFVSEANRLTRFSHPNIVELYDVFEENDTAYICMQLIHGDTLSEYLEKHSLNIDESLKIIDSLLMALEILHQAQPPLLHRDIKPENVILNKDNPVLIDFGSAREYKEGMSTPLTAFITPGYAPPEQYDPNEKCGPYTDIYAAGAVLYKLLTGRKPKEATSRNISEMSLPHQINPTVPVEISAVVMKAMAYNPVERYQTVGEMRDALNKRDQTILSNKASRHKTQKKINGWLYAGSLIILIGVAAIIFKILGHRTESSRNSNNHIINSSNDTIYGPNNASGRINYDSINHGQNDMPKNKTTEPKPSSIECQICNGQGKIARTVSLNIPCTTENCTNGQIVSESDCGSCEGGNRKVTFDCSCDRGYRTNRVRCTARGCVNGEISSDCSSCDEGYRTVSRRCDNCRNSGNPGWVKCLGCINTGIVHDVYGNNYAHTFCSGSGWLRCITACERGYIEYEEQCTRSDCEDGEIIRACTCVGGWKTNRERCNDCGGDGDRERNERCNQTNCNRGIIRVTRTCNNCYGSGSISSNRNEIVDCPDCGG